MTPSHGAEEEASGTTTKASYLQADQRGVRAWKDGHGCLPLRVKDGNGASVWTKVGGDEGLVDSNHDAAAGWEQDHGVRIVGSGPKGKMQDREAIGMGDHRQSLGPLWKGDE